MRYQVETYANNSMGGIARRRRVIDGVEALHELVRQITTNIPELVEFTVTTLGDGE